MTLRRAGCCLLLSLLSFAVAGCASVEAWERGNLAKPQMAFVRTPAQTDLRQHVYSAREGGAGVNAAAPGGCGCD